MASSVTLQKKAIKYFISLAEKLYGFNNFHSLMAIISGLDSVFIQRVDKKRQIIEPVFQRKLKVLSDIISMENNFLRYRGLVHELCSSKQLTVPYLGVYMKDLTAFLGAVQLNSKEEGINWTALRQVQQLLLEFVDLSTLAKKHTRVPDPSSELTFLLCHLYRRSEEDL
eukprot:TRINITY_DN9227_c0_g1_i2.p1 TRINITY_DN9227_c0_g1~~TRINITY_DN9227_c0_g1_i2.p1  ORF type:complete len:169 (+),score=43.61 TRINITY_DN9227_c0_g1_i2:251-757(+)